MNRLCVVAAILVAVACSSSGSGVDGSKKLVSLTSGDQNSECTYIVSLQGSARSIDCGMGVTITVGGDTVAMCVAAFMASIIAHPSCPATVAQAEACIMDTEALTDQQLCTETSAPASCSVVDGALCAGSGG